MINLIRNEWLKLLSTKKLLALLIIILIIESVPAIFTIGGNIFSGQTYPVSILGIIVRGFCLFF